MTIRDFQQWTRDFDSASQWDLLATLQLLSHLTEEVGELAQSVNRIHEYRGEVREQHQDNLRIELVDVLWFLVKIANRFDVDLQTEVERFVERASQWSAAENRGRLLEGLRSLDSEMTRAREGLDLDRPEG